MSTSHIFNFIYCYGFDFDIIRSIKLQFLIQFYFILIEIKTKFQYYVCRIFHLLEFEFALLFYFIILEDKFFSARTMTLFTVNTVDNGFFMSFFDKLITHEREISLGLLSSLDIHTPDLNFRHLAGGRVTAVH